MPGPPESRCIEGLPELRQRDPHNKLFARQTRFRLDAEVVRAIHARAHGKLQAHRRFLAIPCFPHDDDARHLEGLRVAAVKPGAAAGG